MLSWVKNINKKLFCEITEIPPILNKPYFAPIDGLRGVSILSVILCHVAREKTWLKYIDGGVGVHLFFIISGFLITTLLLKEKIKNGRLSFKKFYIRRILRILPVAYLYLLVLIILNNFFNLNITAFSFFTAFVFLKNIPITYDWQTGHYWTLSVEEQFYLLAPILLAYRINSYIKITLILFLIVPIIDFLGYHNVGIFYTNRGLHVITYILINLFARGTLYILAGSFLSMLLFKGVIKSTIIKYSQWALPIFLTALTIHFTCYNALPYLAAIIFTTLLCFVLLFTLTNDNLLSRMLNNPILNWLGKLSYSLYIWQMIFTVYQPWAGHFKHSSNVLLNILALLITASCSYYLYEHKFLQLKKHFKSN